MIDLHNHILPGMDDGAADLDESLAIARQFVSEGVTCAAATPHVNPAKNSGPSPAEVRERVASLRAALDAAEIPLEIMPGSEIFLTPEVPQLLQEGRISTLAEGSAVLVELPFEQRPLYVADTLYDLQRQGFQPVLAHPERAASLRREIDLAVELADRGAVLQLTAPSLLGRYGASVRRTAETLLRRGAYGAAASDRHHPGRDRSLAALHERIRDLMDEETADLLLVTNPARLLEGREIIRPEPVEAQPGLWSRFFP